MQYIFNDHYLYLHIAGIISMAALIFKDQVKMRAVLFVSILFSVASHVVGLPKPAWNDLLWNGTTFFINAIVLTQLLLDRTHIGLNQEQERLYSALKLLTPGEFRSLVKIARWSVSPADQVITMENKPLHRLYYVLDGDIKIEKGGRSFQISPDTFIGEVAFLHNTPASATVTLGRGARYIVWSAPELERTLQSRSALRNAFIRMIGMDTAEKVARA